MAERIQQILQRVREWWGKFSIRQKAVIISVIAVVVVALAILIYVVSRPNMVTLTTAETATQATTIQELLNGEGITYETSSDGMTFYIREQDMATANILLGSNDIPSAGYSINDVIDGSFSTTEADKQKRYQVYLEERFADRLSSLSNVRSAQVTLSIPERDGTLIGNQQDSYANVILELAAPMGADQAAGLAHYIATGLGNDTTERITIIDSDGNVLFSGGDEATSAGIASTNRSLKREAENDTANKVRAILAGSGDASIYDNVEIGVDLVMNFDSTNIVDYHYYVDEGQSQGYLDSRSVSTTEGTGGVQGVPGTDANDDTTYVLQDNQYSSYNTSDVVEDFLPSETITTTDSAVGTIDYDESAISVVAYNYVVYNEDELKADGTLDDMTMDEFVAQNRETTVAEVPEELFTAVANATNIPVANISILAYDVPMFQYSSGGRSLTDWIMIILAVLIIAMLGFVVLRSLRRDEEEELEDEVSVEQLMAETGDAESELDAIGFTEKSEARLMIEQFVAERPEAVATLLRNWLNEDWGE